MKKLIKNVNIFDGKKEYLKKDCYIVLTDNLVTEIGSGAVSEENFACIIDGQGKTAMPGMVDAHVHLGTIFPEGVNESDYAVALSVAVCKEVLLSGFTTVRDAGSVAEGLKKAFDCGVLPGPRIYPCGAYISQTSGHGDGDPAHRNRDIQYRVPSYTALADGVPEVMRAVREQFYRGASHIKLMAGGGCMSNCDPIETVQFSPEEMKAAVDVAKDYGTYVMAHLYTPKAILRAVKAGVMSMEHAHLINEEAAKAVVDAGAFVAPMPQFNKYLDILGPENMPPKDEMVRRSEDTATEVLNKYDVKILFGTDLMITGPDYEAEQSIDLVYYKKRFGSYKGLLAATGNAHDVLSLTTYQNPYAAGKIGVLEEGSYADLLIVDGNPLDDLAVLSDRENLRVIMKDGKIIKNTL